MRSTDPGTLAHTRSHDVVAAMLCGVQPPTMSYVDFIWSTMTYRVRRWETTESITHAIVCYASISSVSATSTRVHAMPCVCQPHHSFTFAGHDHASGHRDDVRCGMNARTVISHDVLTTLRTANPVPTSVPNFGPFSGCPLGGGSRLSLSRCVVPVGGDRVHHARPAVRCQASVGPLPAGGACRTPVRGGQRGTNANAGRRARMLVLAHMQWPRKTE